MLAHFYWMHNNGQLGGVDIIQSLYNPSDLGLVCGSRKYLEKCLVLTLAFNVYVDNISTKDLH